MSYVPVSTTNTTRTYTPVGASYGQFIGPQQLIGPRPKPEEPNIFQRIASSPIVSGAGTILGGIKNIFSEAGRESFVRGAQQTKSALETVGAEVFRNLGYTKTDVISEQNFPRPKVITDFFKGLSSWFEDQAKQSAIAAQPERLILTPKALEMAGLDIEPQTLANALVEGDSEFITRGITGNLPNLLLSLGVGTATGVLTGGSTLPIAISAFLTSGTLEGGFAIREALDAGATPDQARNAGLMVGTINGMLDAVPIVGALKRVPGGQAIRQQIFRRVASGMVKSGLEEGVTEGIQEIVNNAVQRTIDENREFFEGIPEAAFFGAITGGVMGGATQTPVRGLEIEDVSRNIIKQLPEKGFVSKQEVRDAINKTIKQQGIKSEEMDVLTRVLQEFDNERISVQGLAQKLESRLIPLTTNFDTFSQENSAGYETIALPPDKRGDVRDYNEIIYESPIPTSAGNVHFSGAGINNYFAHVRTETVGEEETRRIIEIQSDLFQKNRIQQENLTPEEKQMLDTYQNTWWQRIIREEISRAKKDNEPTLLFPTGETIMNIEGLGPDTTEWTMNGQELLPEDIEVGRTISDGTWEYLITEDLGNKKFKAVAGLTLQNNEPSYKYLSKIGRLDDGRFPEPQELENVLSLEELSGLIDVIKREKIDETIDISGEIDQEHANYKRYENLYGKYLSKHFDAQRITDEEGVSWWRVNVNQISTTPTLIELAREKKPKYRSPNPERLLGKEKPRDITRREDVALRERIRAEARGAKVGAKAERQNRANRRAQVRSIQNVFQLTDREVATIRRGRDIISMDDGEFASFLGEVQNKGNEIFRRNEALTQLKGTIFEKELRRVENLQRAMNLPPISRMSTSQLIAFENTLQQFKTGDEFLSVRKLETVDNTDLKGIKTQREARERLAEETGISVDELSNIKVSELDRFRWDTSLAEKNPFYNLMVIESNKAMLNAEARFLDLEEKTTVLAKKARASRKRGIVDRLIPTDSIVFKYLETPIERKGGLAKQMTFEELEFATYIQEEYAKMRDHLVQHEVLKKYRSDYITHYRRGFLEAWKQDGLLTAFKEMFEQYKVDEARFDILDSETGQILPLEKFFRFSLRRTGELKPTENVAKAFTGYAKSFEKKVALDSIVPKLDIYAHSLTPKTRTPRGLEFDHTLKRFVNEWVNTKKGRVANVVGVKQGGRIDVALRLGKVFTTLLDLGLNIPVGIASHAGENVTNYILLGTKKYMLGQGRKRTKRGREMLKKYKNFVGKTPWDSISEASKNVGERFGEGLFFLFRNATTSANKTFLLGSLTKEEWAKGEVSPQRLAQLKIEMGRYRVVEGAESIIGASSPAGLWKQYKTWAIPPLRTVTKNISTLTKMAKNKQFATKEFQELMRATLSITTIAIAGAFALDGDDEDDSFLKTVLRKTYRDALTLLGALNPTTYTSVRILDFLADLGLAIEQIVTLEEYKAGENEGKLKGPRKFQQTVTPRLLRQFESTKESGNVGVGLPPLPKINLPELPRLPTI